jgi:GntR family transcriptional regulator of vanillate catabolism
MGTPSQLLADSTSQTDRVVFALRERILRGEFRGGERLAELSLVNLLEASRTPVRLALERLAHEGIVDPIAAGGFRVRSFTPADIWDAIEIRGVLEGTAARFAAERLQSPDELATLRSLNTELERLVPMTLSAFVEYLRINDNFHRELWRLAKSGVLLRAVESAAALPFAAPGALVFGDAEAAETGRIGMIAVEHHRAIVEAIQNREGARAEALAREHSRVSRQNLQRALKDKDLLSRLPGGSLIKTGAR